jgi:hypothetical protein
LKGIGKEDAMRGNTRVVLTVAAALILSAIPLWGHHAFTAEFDANKPVKLRGVVTKVELINPHSWIHIDVKEPDGKVVSWAIEGGTPNTLFRLGITKDSLKAGTEVLVDGYQARDGSRKANGRDVTLPDGKKVFIGGSSVGAPQ